MSLTLSPQVFLILSRFIEERTGLHYEPKDMDVLEAKVTPRAIECGFESLLDYYYYLRYDGAGARELEILTERLLVHETYFFRELEPLVTLVDTHVHPRVRDGQRVRVWSAACATGEEPLTLAMLLETRGLLDRVEIVGSDLSEAALDRAEAGAFRGRSLRALPHPEAHGLIDEQGRLAPRITASVRWQRHNLLEPPSLGQFDVILCRNVLIYFADDTARRVVENLAQAMKPDALLLVGVSESLMRFGTMFRCVERRGSFFYALERP